MSYICMIANENGVAAAGDSRLTIEPKVLHLHLNRTRKVGSDPAQGLVWACCGMMVYGGIHYGKLASHVLRQSHRSLGSRLHQIASVLEKATAVRHALGGGNAVFTLLVGSVSGKIPTVRVLDVVNGKSRLRTMSGPVFLQAGWDPSLYQSAPSAEEFSGESPEQLVRRVKERCLWAIRKDTALTAADKRRIQTVGGSVRVAVMEVKQK